MAIAEYVRKELRYQVEALEGYVPRRQTGRWLWEAVEGLVGACGSGSTLLRSIADEASDVT